MFHAHHGNIVQAVEVREGLQVSLVLYQLLRATVQQADVRVCTRDDLSVHLQD